MPLIGNYSATSASDFAKRCLLEAWAAKLKYCSECVLIIISCLLNCCFLLHKKKNQWTSRVNFFDKRLLSISGFYTSSKDCLVNTNFCSSEFIFACGSVSSYNWLWESLFSYGYLLPVFRIALPLSLSIPALCCRDSFKWQGPVVELNYDKPKFSFLLLPKFPVRALAIYWTFLCYPWNGRDNRQCHAAQKYPGGISSRMDTFRLWLHSFWNWLQIGIAVIEPVFSEHVFFPQCTSTFRSYPGAFFHRICGQLIFLKGLIE